MRLESPESTQIQVQRHFARQCAEGEVVFEEGDEGSRLYIIQSGQVEISRSDHAGKRVVARLGPGHFFGEMSVVLGEPRTARAVAVTAASLLELDGQTLEAMCIERPEIAIRLIQRLATRLIAAERRLAALGLDDLVAPLIRYLAARVEDEAGEEELLLPTSLRELATGCSLPLHETYQALHQLVDQKLVRITADGLLISDCSALAAADRRFGGSD